LTSLDITYIYSYNTGHHHIAEKTTQKMSKKKSMKRTITKGEKEKVMILAILTLWQIRQSRQK